MKITITKTINRDPIFGRCKIQTRFYVDGRRIDYNTYLRSYTATDDFIWDRSDFSKVCKGFTTIERTDIYCRVKNF